MEKSKQKKQPSPLSRAEALSYRPVRNPEVRDEILDTGEVMITYPVRVRPWFVRVAQRFGWDSDEPMIKKLQLDELGTATWKLMDGKRSVKQIVREFAADYQLQAKEAEVSVTAFIRELGKRGIIGLQ